MARELKFALVGEKTALAKLMRQVSGRKNVSVPIVFSDGVNGETPAFVDCAEVLKCDAINTETGRAAIAQVGATWIVSICNYDYMISRETLAHFPKRSINLHFGKLPEYAGRNGYQWAIRNGETQTAVTLHEMTFPFDSGDVVAERSVPIGPADTGITIYRRCVKEGVELTADFLLSLAEGRRPIWTTQPCHDRKGYLASDVGDGKIDWAMPIESIRNFVRAGNFRPFSSPNYTPWFRDDEGVRRLVFDVETLYKEAPGRVVGEIWREDGRLIVRACDGVVVILNSESAPSERN